ncbi:Por secretion system C-terminal sorting domain-containing protein [Aquiflexum balticum DSM 16537]|uniref:Por secretion system C-terminal sorting domain-containing protein n=1 Tax=Aquiflexum balticum DSM 16537 TaxID=758820 RepID=A0A1W2H3J7_9BACT|nr:T9SS type A sorting domain-containing protein [Aquiflexum balticum]SMD43517.1 Por secretion system C-terminal sorting domain-containing protein [Aquiflexum balticum DSM 16537]
MKSFLPLLFILTFILSTHVGAQVRVLSENTEFSGKIGSSQRKSLIIQNESNQENEYFLKFLRGNVGSSQNIKICIADKCFDPKKDLSKIKLTLSPNEIFTDLYLEFDLGITETRGNFDLHFVNSENLRDVFVIEAVYDVFNPSVEETNHKDISIGSIYPNPSNRIAQIDYDFKNPNAVAKISINSFIGNPVAEYILDPVSKSLVINVANFNPGVYFYTLYVDNKNIVTKKLVVKK